MSIENPILSEVGFFSYVRTSINDNMKLLVFIFILCCTTTVFAQADSIHTKVDETAHFPGDSKAMHLWIEENLTFPDSVRMNAEFVTHFSVSFVVESDGRLTEIRVIRPDNTGWNRHIASVIKSMPHWIPAKVDGITVRSKIQLPINLSPE